MAEIQRVSPVQKGTTMILDGLNPHTTYDIYIRAYSKQSPGMLGKAVQVITMEEGM